jgi:hypothetical protein
VAQSVLPPLLPRRPAGTPPKARQPTPPSQGWNLFLKLLPCSNGVPRKPVSLWPTNRMSVFLRNCTPDTTVTNTVEFLLHHSLYLGTRCTANMSAKETPNAV